MLLICSLVGASYAQESRQTDLHTMLRVVGPCPVNGIHEMNGEGTVVMEFPNGNSLPMTALKCIHCGELMFCTGYPMSYPNGDFDYIGYYLLPGQYTAHDHFYGVTYISNTNNPHFTSSTTLEGYEFIK